MNAGPSAPSVALRPLPHLSDQARAQLAVRASISTFPDLEDAAGWSALVSAFDGQAAIDLPGLSPDFPTRRRSVGACDVYVATPPDVAATDGRILLSFHGGGLIYLGGALVHYFAGIDARTFGLKTWSVDYRMPPAHPYPAAVDDGFSAYEAICNEYDPANIIVAGNSAGGNVALATMIRARDAGLPLPAALMLLSPEVDLTESGDSFTTLADKDPTLASLLPVNELYAGQHALDDPGVSPLFADLQGLPPTFVQTGTRDLFLSNAVRLHRRLLDARVRAELHVFEARPHSGFGGAPEDAELEIAIRQYVAQQLRVGQDPANGETTRSQ